MGKKPKGDGFTHDSFKDDKRAIGGLAGGKLDTFPLSELAARTKKRDEEDEAVGYAMEQSEAGFPEEEE